MNDTTGKELFDKLLTIHAQIDNICQRHQLRYWAIAGTLLGAVRHHGFIPWDDDMDLVMPRKDYDLFLKFAKKELPEGLFLQTTATEACFPLPFARIRDSNTTATEEFYLKYKCKMNMGLWVAVFPLDVWPKPNASRFSAACRAHWLANKIEGILMNAYFPAKRTIRGKLKTVIARMILLLLRRRFMSIFRDSLLRRFANCIGDYVVFADLGEKRRFPMGCFEKTEYLPFEHVTMPIPGGYDAILKLQYGDWRIPVKGLGQEHAYVDLDLKRSYKEVVLEKYGYEA